MKRYLIPIQQAGSTDTIQRIPVDDDPVGIYRLDDDSYRIVAEQNGRTIELGPTDASVSRKKDDRPPVELSPTDRGIEVQNRNSTNPISVDTTPGIEELDKGEWIEITEDCVIELGFKAKIRANVRGTPEAQTEESDEPTEAVELHRYINRLTENVDQAVKRDDVAECRSYMQKVLDTLIESPVDASAYDEIKADVEQRLNSLDKKVNNKTLDKSFDEQKKDQIQHLTERVSDMYERH